MTVYFDGATNQLVMIYCKFLKVENNGQKLSLRYISAYFKIEESCCILARGAIVWNYLVQSDFMLPRE